MESLRTMGRVLHSFCLIASLLLAGCAGEMPLAPAFLDSAAAEIARRPDHYSNGGARAFLVRRDGQDRGLIWGTMHIPYGAETELPRPIRERLYAASDLSVEVVADRMDESEREQLRVTLDDANRAADTAALAQLDPVTRTTLERTLPGESLSHYSLRGLAMLVAARATQPSRNGAGGFVDLTLIGFARSMNKPVLGLEEPQLPDPTIYAPNGYDAAGLLRLNLRRHNDLAELRRWARAEYAKGEIADTLAGLAAWQATPDDLTRNDRDRESLLDRRNIAWLPRLTGILDSPGYHFVAFGAAHLPGKKGIVSLLRSKGYEVLACPADRCPD